MRCFGDGVVLYERYHDLEWGRFVVTLDVAVPVSVMTCGFVLNWGFCDDGSSRLRSAAERLRLQHYSPVRHEAAVSEWTRELEGR